MAAIIMVIFVGFLLALMLSFCRVSPVLTKLDTEGFEELALSEENTDRTRHPKISAVQNAAPDWQNAEEQLERLRQASHRGDPVEVLAPPRARA